MVIEDDEVPEAVKNYVTEYTKCETIKTKQSTNKAKCLKQIPKNENILNDFGNEKMDYRSNIINDASSYNNQNCIENNKNISNNISQISDNDINEQDLHGIIEKRHKYINNPQISYLNVNSLRNKIHNIRNLTTQLLPSILALSETKLDNSFPDSQFFIQGYQNPTDFRKDRTRDGGGLITFVKNGILCRRISKMEPPDLEVICIEVDFGKRKWAIISVYR